MKKKEKIKFGHFAKLYNLKSQITFYLIKTHNFLSIFLEIINQKYTRLLKGRIKMHYLIKHENLIIINAFWKLMSPKKKQSIRFVRKYTKLIQTPTQYNYSPSKHPLPIPESDQLHKKNKEPQD